MRALLQRVDSATVTVADETVGAISEGLLAFLGVARGDSAEELEWLAGKILGLRIFNDATGRMNRSVGDIGGSVLLVSQFTLQANVQKGRRPGFDRAAPPEAAESLYRLMAERLSREIPTQTGRFGADMRVHLCNHGPATFLVDTAERQQSSR